MITADFMKIITVVSVLAAIYFGYRSMTKTSDAEIKESARESATIMVKLDDIGTDVKDIKYDISETKKEVHALDVRVAIAEKSMKSMHKRLDQHVGAEEKEEEER